MAVALVAALLALDPVGGIGRAAAIEASVDAPPVAVEIPGGPGYAEEFVDLGDLALFVVNTSEALASELGLWVSDGTEEGTSQLELPEGKVARLGRRFQTEGPQSTVRDGVAYFAVGEGGSDSPLDDPEIWVSDGTQAGTERLDLNDAFQFDQIHEMATFGDRIAIYARHHVGEDTESRVFLLDDSAEGARTVGGGSLGDFPPRMAALGDELYVGTGTTLDRIDQAGARTIVWSFAPTGLRAGPSRLTPAGDQLFFRIRDDGEAAIYVHKPTTGETLQVTPRDLEVIRLPMVTADDQVFFFAGADARRLWVSDGTSAGTREVWPDDLGAGYTFMSEPDEDQVIAAGGRLIFPAPGSGSTLWTTNGDPDATRPLQLDGEDLRSGGFGVGAGDQAWLLGPDRGLVRTDGTSAGTVLAEPEALRVSAARRATFYPIGLVGDVPIFNGDTGFEEGRPTERRLWRIDADGPTWPADAELRTSSVGSTVVALEWPVATGDGAVTAYRVLADGEFVARTDAGTTSVTLDGLDSGATIRFEVQAMAGFGAGSDALTLEVTLDEGTGPAPSTGAITGTVTDARTGEPLVAATVTAIDADSAAAGTLSGLDGTYRIDGREPGTFRVLGSATGYQSLTIGDVQIVAGETTTVDLALEPDGVEEPAPDPQPEPTPPPAPEPEPEPVTDACPTDTVPTSTFDDIDGNVHADAIDCAAWYGIAQGLTADTYGPARNVARGQMASFLARTIETAGVALPEHDDDAFGDIADSEHRERINQLAAIGVIAGRTPTIFDPSAPVTRAQTASLLVRTYLAVTGEQLPSPVSPFTDTEGSVHADAIGAAYAADLTRGRTATTFDPNDATRRDQAAAFLTRLLDRFAAEGLVTHADH